MEPFTGVAESIRQMMEGYQSLLSTMARTLETLPAQGEERRRAAEQWLGLLRASKDGLIAAIEQGFQAWERECRRLVEAGPGPVPGAAGPLEAWAESWTKGMGAFTAAARPREARGGEAARHAEGARQAMEDALRAWQRLWLPSDRTP